MRYIVTSNRHHLRKAEEVAAEEELTMCLQFLPLLYLDPKIERMNMELIKHTTSVLNLSSYLIKVFGVPIKDANRTPRYSLVPGDVTIHSVNGDDLMRIDDVKLIILMTESKYLLNRNGILGAVKMFEDDRDMTDDLQDATVSLKIVTDGTDLRFEHDLMIEAD